MCFLSLEILFATNDEKREIFEQDDLLRRIFYKEYLGKGTSF